MASIREEIVVEAAAARVWAAVRDVGAVHRRLTPGLVIGTRLDGAVRTLFLPGGGRVRELIVDVDDDARRLAYAVTQGRLPLLHHHASFQVIEEAPGRCTLVWVTDLLPDDAAPEARRRIARGATVMKRVLEGADA